MWLCYNIIVAEVQAIKNRLNMTKNGGTKMNINELNKLLSFIKNPVIG